MTTVNYDNSYGAFVLIWRGTLVPILYLRARDAWNDAARFNWLDMIAV